MVDTEKMTAMTEVTEEMAVMETEEIIKETAVTEMEETIEETLVEKIKAETAKEDMVKRTGEMQETEMEIENMMEESESVADSYQNCHNTRQTDGKMILYTLRKKKLNQE
jgi:hypothetical protein